MLDHPIIVVLPMHNGERYLRSAVLDILELSHSMTASLDIVVVDDGSTDETFETACELARTYPQVKVFRQQFRQGLSAALELVKNRTAAEMIMIHDGISPIETSQLKTLLRTESQSATHGNGTSSRDIADLDSRGSRRFASIRALHASMEQAHQSLAGFRWIRLEKPLIPRRCRTSLESIPADGAMRAAGSSSNPLIQMPMATTSVPMA